MPTLLAHAREAGAATVLRVLVPQFRRVGWRVLVDLNAVSKAVFDDGELLVGKLSTDEGIDLVLCGYDAANRDETGDLLRQAQALGLPSIGILDAWKGIDRFWYGDGTLRPLADAVCVPDRILAHWLVTRGVPSGVVCVVEHPMIAALRATRDEDRNTARLAARQRLGLEDPERPTLVFFSEPLRLPAGGFSSLAQCPMKEGGLSLHQWLEEEYGDSHSLVMSCHPVEPMRTMCKWRATVGLSLPESLFLADQVVGVGSTVLAYAVSCGIATRNVHSLISWDPRESHYEPQIWQHLIEAGLFEGDRGGGSAQSDTVLYRGEDIVALANSLLALYQKH